MADEVRVKLSAEGVNDVVAAFRKVEAEAKKSAGGTSKAFSKLRGIAAELGRLLPVISGAAVVGGLTKLATTGLKVADDMGKLAQKTGSATEGLSVLTFAAATADVETQQLGGGLIKLAVNLAKLRDGADEAEDAFAQLGLTKDDFAGKKTDQAFALIAERLGRVENSADKTALAVKLFGKAGAELIPLLNDVAEKGIGPLTERARELGLIIDDQTAAAAQAANDAFETIGLQARGLAVQFATGFAPVITQVMESFTEDTKGGAESMQSFGRSVGRTIQAIVGIFRIFGNIAGAIFDSVGKSIGALAAATVAVFKGEFSQAVEILKARTEDALSSPGIIEQFKKDVARLVNDLNTDPPELKLKPVVDPAALEDVETANERAEREAAERALRTAEEKAAREAEAERREQERLRSEREDFEVKLLEMQGRRREAALRALDEEIRKLDIVLQKTGTADAERLRQLEQYRAIGTAQITATEQLEQAQRELDALARERQAVENQVILGKLSEAEAEQRIKTIESERLVVLRQIAAAALAAAQATGDPEAIARAQALNTEVENLAVSVQRTGQNLAALKEGIVDSIGQGAISLLDQGIQRADDFGDVLRGALLLVVDSIRQIALELIRSQLIKYLGGLFGGFGGAGGGGIGAAEGGYVQGPGTSTSDSIPARLSRGEFVVRASVVRQPGVLQALAQLNHGIGSLRTRGMPRFAEGGMVQGGAPAQPAQQAGIRVVNVLDATMVTDAISSPAGERTLLNVIKRNSGSLRRLFGG